MAAVYDIFEIPNVDAGVDGGMSRIGARFCRFLRDSAGWTIPRSGIGGVGPVGDNLGSGNMNSSTDWVCMQSPDGMRQFEMVRATNNASGSFYYSPGALFTGGTGTTRATASDEVILVDGNNPFDSPSGTPGIRGIGTFYADSSSPYGFYMLGWTGVFNDILCRLIFDPMFPGSGDPTDPDPYVWHVGAGAAGPGNFTESSIGSEATGTNIDRCVGTIGGGTFRGTIPGLCYRASSTLVVPGDSPRFNDPSFTTALDLSWPIFYARRTSLGSGRGYKGMGSIVRWNGLNRAGLGETLDGKNRIMFGSINVPWNGTTPIA